ncbi:hypothetical protein [Parashewanella curva]|uniref:hypothetical protein n=1 Tax=Parashewanella curva TaxID=2338552 RepID=UPI0010599E34|nr:hypothetical protein [Parashewanella curva]
MNSVTQPSEVPMASAEGTLGGRLSVQSISNLTNKTEYSLFLALSSLNDSQLEMFGEELFLEGGRLKIVIILKDCKSLYQSNQYLMREIITQWLQEDETGDKSWGHFLDIVERFLEKNSADLGDRKTNKLQKYCSDIRIGRGGELAVQLSPLLGRNISSVPKWHSWESIAEL